MNRKWPLTGCRRGARVSTVLLGLSLGAFTPPTFGEGEPPSARATATHAGGADSPDLWRTPKQCGRNAAYMMLKLYGINADYRGLAAEIPVFEGGSRLSDLAKSVRARGLDVQAVRATPDSLERIPLPAIAHSEEGTGQGHYVVLLRVSPESVSLIDGTTARRVELGRDQFHDLWSGHLLVLKSPSWAGAIAGGALVAGAGILLFATFLQRQGAGRRHPSDPDPEPGNLGSSGQQHPASPPSSP